MFEKYPETILISHDDYHAKHIGRTADNRQFFLTTPFVPAHNQPGCEYIALYYFDMSGKYLESNIQNLGSRAELDDENAKALYERILSSIPNPVFSDINISPFKIKFEGIDFGLFPYDDSEDDDEDNLALQIQPGDYMSFFSPWEGEYDT